MKSRKVTRIALLEVEINKYIEQIDTVVTGLNGTNIFLEYNWLVKHNLEAN